MLRALLLLLVLANAAYFGWMQGWLAPWLAAPRPEQREPGRLAAQLQPELITVMSPVAASAALAAARAAEICLEAGPFSDAALPGAEALLVQSGVGEGSWTREPVAKGAAWAVYMGRFADRDVMRAKGEELKRLSVAFEELNAPPLLAPGIRISSHDDRAAAEAALAALAGKGVRTARVVEIGAGSTQTWLRFARADAELQARLKAVPTGGLGAAIAPCARAAQ